MESMRETIATPPKFFFRVLVLMAAMALMGVVATTSGAAEGNTTRVSVDSSGNEAEGTTEWGENKGSYNASISAGGRFVAFDSRAPNLVLNDTNESRDVFVHDRQTGTTRRVSIDSSGSQANSGSGDASISSDGRFVAFNSYAANLVPNDTNGVGDTFVHDRQTGATQRVNIDNSGNQANKYSCCVPSISSEGRFVTFDTAADNLVPNDTNDDWDIFVHDRQMGTTERVSIDSLGNQAKQDQLRLLYQPRRAIRRLRV